jgi:hypothetical protein
LTLELENRDIKLMTDGVALTEEESICWYLWYMYHLFVRVHRTDMARP